MSVGTNQSLLAKCVFGQHCVFVMLQCLEIYYCRMCFRTPILAHFCVSARVLPGRPIRGIPRWALSRWKGSNVGGEGVEVAGQLGRGGGLMGPGTGPVARHQAH